MSTAWEPIEIQAMTYIKNDASLDWDRTNRLAVFYNRMADYMRWAMFYFDRPPEMLAILNDYTEPQFEDMDYTVAATSEAPTTIESGALGYDVCSIGITGVDPYGNPTYEPLMCIYDSVSGDVVVNASLTEGQTISLNFYKSGSFNQKLNRAAQGILAFGIYAAWEHRFDNNALERTAKIRDASFTTISEASHMNSNTVRQKHVMDEFYSKLRQYEQNQAYFRVVKR